AAFRRVTDDQAAIEPELQGITDFPASIQSLATIATPNGQRQRAVLIAGHFASGSAPGVGTQRLYDSLAGTVLYSSSADYVRPTIRNVQVSQVGSTIGFAADVADLDASGGAGTIKEALVLYLDGTHTWHRANLTCASGRCTGGGPVSGTSVDYIVEAVDAGGNVGINANKAATENVAPPTNTGHITVTYSASPTSSWFTGSPVTATFHSDIATSFSSSLDGGAYADGASVTISGDGLHTLDVRGNDGSTASFLVPIDTLAPTISIFSPVDGSYLLAGDVVKADYSCSDAGSGLAATGGCVGPVASGSPIDNTPGNKTFTVNAKDALGHTSSKSVSYQVWPFTGFLSPVDNPPTINVAKGGSAIPVKFSLGGNRGTSFGTFTSKKVDCATDAPQDAIETTVTAGGSSLQFDSTSNQYTYVWKTDSSYAGTCRDFTITFTNGDTRTARFKFK